MLKLSIVLVGLALIGCSEQLVDQSAATIQYRVISLPGSTRRQIIDQQFNTLKAAIQTQNGFKNAIIQPSIDSGYFDAILGRNLDRPGLIAAGYFTGSLNDGELGLVKTSTDIVIPAAAALADNTIQVNFEDDVVLPVDLDLSLRFALRAVPADWDMLFLGCNQGTINNGPFFPNSGQLICPSKALAPIPGTPWSRVTVLCLPGAYAYALSNASAKKLQNLIEGSKPISSPIDILYQDFFGSGKINAYCLTPELVRPNYALDSAIGAR